MKKVISLILSVLLVISCTCSVTLFANADESASFSIGNIESRAGSTVEIPIEIKNNPGITSFRIVVEYDSVILKLTNIAFKEAAQGFNTGTSQIYDSPYSISGYNSGIDITNNGQLAVLTFEINQYAEEGRYDITLSYDEDDVFNMAGDNVTFALKDGFVEVTPCQHTGGEWEYIQEETCTEDGIMIKKCEICGNEYESKKVHAKGHSFSDWTVKKPAACTENGEKSRVCSLCTYEESEVINALGHNYPDEFTIDKIATCTENGEKSKYCTRCNNRTEVTTVNSTGHSFGEWEIAVSPDCTNSGSKQRVCKNCGFTETENLNPNGHKWNNDYTVDISATCTTDGSKSIHCLNCDSVKDSQIIKSTGHNFGNWQETVKADCFNDGAEIRFCSNCNMQESRIISKLGHNYSEEFVIDKKASCTEYGEKSRHCSRCDLRTDITVISSTGHSYDDWITDKEPTNISAGSKYKVCERCFEKTYDIIPKLAYEANPNDNVIELSSNRIIKGKSGSFVVVSSGIENINPIENDTRYIPIGYSYNGIDNSFNNQYNGVIYTDKMAVGEHLLSVIFAKQKFNDGEWVNIGENEIKSEQFYIVEKSVETEVDNNEVSEKNDVASAVDIKNKNTSNKSPKTGSNMSALTVSGLVLFIASVFSVKKRRSNGN